MADTAIFDVDGPLVDTNYQHALAWFRALRRYGITLPMWRIHRGIGMGGDMFVPEVAGREVEKTHGDDLRTAWEEEFDELIGEIQPFEGAYELLAEVKQRGFRWSWPVPANASTSRRSSTSSTANPSLTPGPPPMTWRRANPSPTSWRRR